MLVTLFNLISAVAILFVTYCVYNLHQVRRFKQLVAQNGCKPTRLAYNKLPFALDRKWKLLTTRGNEIDRLMMKRFNDLGCWVYTDNVWGITPIVCADPRLVKAILGTNFKDWNVGEGRHDAMGPWLGYGIFVSDGLQWSNARSILRPNFANDDIYDLSTAEVHFEKMLQVLPSGEDGWTTRNDLHQVIRRFTLDVVTEIFCGGSINSQKNADQVIATNASRDVSNVEVAFDDANKNAALRLRAGPFWRLINPSAFRIACATFTSYANQVIEAAMTWDKSKKECEVDEKGKYLETETSFATRLVASTDDRVLMRDVLVQMLFAGIDTSTSLLGFALLNLARTEGAWQRLRDELHAIFGEDENAPLTPAGLKSCSYLQNIVKETLRLYPSIPMNSREAVKDTILPSGGGEDGESPILVLKGTPVRYSCYVIHRRPDIWGPDVLDWKPDRWIGRHHGWEYLPFNGGARICLGQKFSLGEAAFFIARLAQTFDKTQFRNPEPAGRTLDTRFDTALFPMHGVQVRFHRAFDV